MIYAEITLADGSKRTSYERTWEDLLNRVRGLEITCMSAVRVRVADIRQGRGTKEATTT